MYGSDWPYWSNGVESYRGGSRRWGLVADGCPGLSRGEKQLVLADNAQRFAENKLPDDASDRAAALHREATVIVIHDHRPIAPGVAQALDAIDDLATTGGIETVALGVDLFPTEGDWGDFQRAQGTTDISWAVPDLGYLPAVTRGLVARGHTDDAIRAMLGGNFLRVCRRVVA